MANPCAVIGVGQTHHQAKRDDVSIAGMVREAVDRALLDAECTLKDIDTIVLGKAPDMFEGIMMPEHYLADALGAANKPILRVHTAGSVGGSTGLVAASHVQAGRSERVLAIAFEKQSESEAMWALSPRYPFRPPVVAGAGGYFAPIIRSYIERTKAPDHVGHVVAVKDRKNALKNPYAHLRMPDISLDAVRASPMLWDPIRYLDTCPSSDGACAMVLASEAVAKRTPRAPAWVLGGAMRSENHSFPGRDEVSPVAGRECAKDVYAQARITDPRRQIDVAETYVPFSWYEPMWLENLGFAEHGQGWRLTDAGATEIGGDIPINPSGGVMSSNPIGASGLIRFAEAALQVRGAAGEHQVEGAKIALGHAYGGGAQFFAMWIVGRDKP